MKEMIVERLTLGSFMKLSGAAGAAFGILAGIVGLFASFFGADVFITIGGLPRFTGILAGVVGLPLMPIFFGILGIVLAIVLYWPFIGVVRLFGGVHLYGR